MQDAPALEIRSLFKHFAGLAAISDVSFAVCEGSLTALIGPNGAGKTTLFNLITNLLQPSAGEVLFHGRSLRGKSPRRVADLGLIRTFQTARVFPGMTVLENIMAGHHRNFTPSVAAQFLWLPDARRSEAELRKTAAALLDVIGLSRFRDTHAADLPMGAQKLIEVARALMAKPRLLLLDEPAAGLNDTETAELAALLKAVNRTDVTILLVEHNMPLVMGVADHVVVLEAGSVIASGEPRTVQSDPRVIDAYLGHDRKAA